MDPMLYEVVSEGMIDVLRQYNDQLDRQLTPNQNCVLHVAAQFGRSECVREILAKCPPLLRWVNVKGDTPLHVAAREGYYDVVQELVEHANKLNIDDLESGRGGGAAITPVQEMLRATNKDGDTALHLAVYYPPRLVSDEVKRIVELLTREDPEFLYPPNDANETPLYLAAERPGFDEVLSIIVKTCKSPAYGGPSGQTALHAAVRHYRAESTNILLNWKPCLTKEADTEGWTPLHYAARNYNNHGVKPILECDKSTAYVIAKKDNGNAALHVAAIWGQVSVMEELLSHCPDCWEILNSEGQNVLHVAVDMEREKVIKFILKQSWFLNLVNQKDVNGDTPLHLFVAPFFYPENVCRDLLLDDGVNRNIFNNNNKTAREQFHWVKRRVQEPLDYFTRGERNMVRNDRDNIVKWKVTREEKVRDHGEIGRNDYEDEKSKVVGTHIIVATLITTFTFTAAFTIPGGYDGNLGREQGMAILVRETAFRAFAIANTTALICSTTSVFLYLTASLYHLVSGGNKLSSSNYMFEYVFKRWKRHATSLILILVAMFAMMVAFITGSYAVLAHSLGLAITICVIGCVPLLIYFRELIMMWQTYNDKGVDVEELFGASNRRRRGT